MIEGYCIIAKRDEAAARRIGELFPVAGDPKRLGEEGRCGKHGSYGGDFVNYCTRAPHIDPFHVWHCFSYANSRDNGTEHGDAFSIWFGEP